MKIADAIAYLEDILKETDEKADCSKVLQAELLEQAGHYKTAISALEKQVNGELIERVYCKDCKHSQLEDQNRVYCTIKGRLSNKQSFCEAMERK